MNFGKIAKNAFVTKNVEAGQGFVSFYRVTNPLSARSTDLIVVEQNEKISFIVQNNTVIEEINVDNIQNSDTFIALRQARTPSIENLAITEVSYTSAKLNSSVADGGNPAYTSRGFCVTTELVGIQYACDTIASGLFQKSLTDLSDTTTYYAISFLDNGSHPRTYSKLDSFTTYKLCGDKEYNRSAEFCYNGIIHDRCNENTYNPATEFCSDYVIYTKCNGIMYNPATEFCTENEIYAKCASKIYTPSIQYCIDNAIVPKCEATLTVGTECSLNGLTILKMKSETKEFVDAGDYSYPFNKGFPATIEVYALGAGGGGQSGNRNYWVISFSTDRGVGGAGGGGAAVYAKLSIEKPTDFNITVGKGGSGGKSRDQLNCGPTSSGEAGNSGNSGEGSSVIFGSTIITAGGGACGGGTCGGGMGNTSVGAGIGGVAGEKSSGIEIEVWEGKNGDRGDNGNMKSDVATQKGGAAAKIESGSKNPFGGGLGATKNSYAQVGGGGIGGYDAGSTGIDGGDGKVIIVVTYPE
ncbi:hypothetical protein AGMMS49938_00640 [Fibrobacterales bacterium]|nr:hypothetical protein AGMMS49938_00640 [Fibrobacterales bacterium]